MSGEKARNQPDGKEDGTDSSLNLKTSKDTSKETLEGTNEAEATSEVTTINNQQLSDDSLEDDAVADTPVVNNEARDTSKVDAGHNTNTETNTTAAEPASDANEGSQQCKQSSDINGKLSDDKVSRESNGGNCVTPATSNGHSTINGDNVSKATASEGSLQSNSLKSSQLSSRFSSSSSRIPILKGSKGKPSPLVEPHKASTSSVTTTTPGEFPHQEVNSPALQTSENTGTPVSIALQDIPSSDALHQNVNETGYASKETSFSINPKEARVTTLTYQRGWNGHNSMKKPSQLPVPAKRRQDGRVLRNSNSFNSYVHEQMAITMAMMEANFEGVGLSNTQQERVEELRAGLDSFSLTNIIAPEQDKTVFKNGRHHHDNHGYGSHRDTWLPDHQRQYGVDYHRTRPSHDTGIQLMYRSQSYSNNPDHVSYGGNVHNQRRGSELSHSDSFRAKRSNSYLQQQLDRQGSYLQQSKLAQSIKVITSISPEQEGFMESLREEPARGYSSGYSKKSLRPPKLKPLPRKRSSNNYLEHYMKSSTNKSGAGGRINNLQWSPAHVMPPLDESTPLSHTHYWDPTLGSHMIPDSSYGDGYYHQQHHYPVLPNIGEAYSSISLHSVKPYNSYQQQCPGPPHRDATHPGGHYYAQHDYWRHRS